MQRSIKVAQFARRSTPNPGVSDSTQLAILKTKFQNRSTNYSKYWFGSALIPDATDVTNKKIYNS